MRITALILIILVAIGYLFTDPIYDEYPRTSGGTNGAIAFDWVNNRSIYPSDTQSMAFDEDCQCWDLKSNINKKMQIDTVSIWVNLDDELETKIDEAIEMLKD
jgi:hypothetical protein